MLSGVGRTPNRTGAEPISSDEPGRQEEGGTIRRMPKPAHDHSRRLDRFAEELEQALGDAAGVERTELPAVDGGVEITPVNPEALGVSWVNFGTEVVLQTRGKYGGRWELGVSDPDLDLLEAIVLAVVDGRVEEVRGWHRSRVAVTLGDGRRLIETGALAPLGCLLLPFWKRWGTRVQYAPYRV